MRTCGLTLVEVLVVIAILALLLGIFLPAGRKARDDARATVCAANVKQLLLALGNYEAEHGMYPYGCAMPEPGAPVRLAGSAVYDFMGRWWFDRCLEVNHTTEDGFGLLQCPSKRQMGRVLRHDILVGNYGANLALCRVKRYLNAYNGTFRGEPLSSSHVSHPGSTLLLVDAGYSLICWWHATQEPPVTLEAGQWVQYAAYIPGLRINPMKDLWPGQTEDAFAGRHPHKTVNVGFVDGHVNRRPADELLVELTGDKWNCAPLWQPDGDVPVTSETTP